MPWGETFWSTSKLITSSFLGYLNGRVDNVLVSATLGTRSMAFYSLAWNLARLPYALVEQVVGSVLVPALASVSGDRDRTGRIVRESLDHAYVVLLPIAAWLVVSGDALVVVVFGAKWLPLVPCLRVMSLTLVMAPVAIVVHGLLVAAGQAHRVAMATTSQLVTLLVLVPLLAYHGGLLGAAIADTSAMLVVTGVLYAVMRAWLPSLRLSVVRAAALPLGSTSVAALLAWIAGSAVDDSLVRCLVQTFVLGVAYVALVWRLDRSGRLQRLLAGVRGAVRIGRPSATPGTAARSL